MLFRNRRTFIEFAREVWRTSTAPSDARPKELDH